MTSKHIGIVACSAEGAALCYRTLAAEGPLLMGRYAHPEVSLHTHPLSRYMDCIYRDDWAGVGSLMLDSAQRLAHIGADFLICPDNTIHQSLDAIRAQSPLPWLHIAEESKQPTTPFEDLVCSLKLCYQRSRRVYAAEIALRVSLRPWFVPVCPAGGGLPDCRHFSSAMPDLRRPCPGSNHPIHERRQ